MDPQPQMEYGYSKKQITLAMTAIFAVYGVMTYFVQFLPIARPKMTAELNGMALYSWSLSIPSLVSAFATLIFGKFSDLYGRRFILMVSLSFALVGAIMSAATHNFIFLIVATSVGAVGAASMMPLVFAVVGDMHSPEKRGMWIGLLNIPTLVFAAIGPTLGGWLTDNLSWRWIYYISIPLVIFCLLTVRMGVPSVVRKTAKTQIDYLGCVLVLIAAATMIIGLSYAGTYPWSSTRVISLLAISVLFWILFIGSEFKAKEPVLDPLVFKNRIFLTVAGASLFSFFGQIGIFMYFPMFLQGVQGRGAALSGFIITPFSALMAAVGIPTGFLLARSKRYKWMYVLGFGMAAVDMFGIVMFNQGTPQWAVFSAAAVIGIGMGVVPTINTLVIQNTMPKKLLGVAMGAVFFCISMGTALAPAVLGSAMNSSSASHLAISLPDELKGLDKAVFDKLTDSKVLYNNQDLDALRQSIKQMWPQKETLFEETVKSIRASHAAGLRSAFLVGAIAMLISFFLICTIPEVSLDVVPEKEKAEVVKS
jgi:MFS family permease